MSATDIRLEGIVTRVVRVLMAVREEDQGDLADILGIKRQAVSDKMHGRIRWSLDDIEAMADHYGVRSADFLRTPEELIINRRRVAA